MEQFHKAGLYSLYLLYQFYGSFFSNHTHYFLKRDVQ